ncbi:hypothetical protein [Allobranchiibius huperziae]|uniref:DUF8017 domain-containing protein n=1 Tax=Allobranchiibius huperziae TaxID=1874116 RepID=A0A853D8G4_9MICO|nr:hypothetical protein [Allobranchiibius huperziae]NYJ73472.1 hypothetical protein [Allobranchiibius huperziae]
MSDHQEPSSQDRYYQRYEQAGGGFGGPGGRRRRTGAWILGGAAALVVILVAVVAFVLVGRGGTNDTGASSSSSTSSSNVVTASASPTTGAQGALFARPVVPGWQAVGGVVNDEVQIYGAYDAPPNWQVKQDNAIYYDTAQGTKMFGQHTSWGLSELNYGKCAAHPNNSQANASFVDIGKRDPVDAVQGVLQDFASAASLNKDKSTHAAQGTVSVQNTTVAGGSIPAVRGTITATGGTLNADCGTGRTTTFQAVAFTTNGRSVMVLVAIATWPGYPAPAAGTIDKILSSVRPAGG